ncbi:MAG: hypothetical protein IT445_12180 [Phycisphaeraceae bacterium]|nr:hypothetical protein [Phycisphaeraceae bacterium]
MTAGKVLHEDWMWSGKLICVESLKITVHTEGGERFSSDVCMAVCPYEDHDEGDRVFHEDELYVTMEARARLSDSEIWHHLGGFNDEGDSWDTQQYDFSHQLDDFWAHLMGPDEPLRQRLIEATSGMKDNWRSVTIHASGRVAIHFKDGTEKKLVPPQTQGD